MLKGVLGRGEGTGAVIYKDAKRESQGGSLHCWGVTENPWFLQRPENWEAQDCHRRPQDTSVDLRWAQNHSAQNSGSWIVAQLRQKYWEAAPSHGI